MSSTAAATFVAFLLLGSLLAPSEASARSAGISQRAVAPRGLAPAGTQCFGAGCGPRGPLPSVRTPFFQPRFNTAPLRRYDRAFHRRRTPYDVGFTGGDQSLGESTYSAQYGAYGAPTDSGPRGCTSQYYRVPSENYGGSRTVTVWRCYGMYGM